MFWIIFLVLVSLPYFKKDTSCSPLDNKKKLTYFIK